MKRRKVIFYVVVVLVALMGLFAVFGATNSVINFAATAPANDDPEQLQKGFEQVPSDATQDQVIALMGSHERVEPCPPVAPSDNPGPICAHIYHYQAGDQAWDLTFDMDGNLMSKRIGSVQ